MNIFKWENHEKVKDEFYKIRKEYSNKLMAALEQDIKDANLWDVDVYEIKTRKIGRLKVIRDLNGFDGDIKFLTYTKKGILSKNWTSVNPFKPLNELFTRAENVEDWR